MTAVLNRTPATPAAWPPERSLQRDIAERLLLSVLQAEDAADRKETSLTHAEFLAQASFSLGMSLNSSVTRMAVAGMALPIPGTWCIVDLIEIDGTMSRLPILHPDVNRRGVLHELSKHWLPAPGDPFGGPAVQAEQRPIVIARDVDAALTVAAHSQENLQLLRQLQIGTLLTVPLISGQRLLGAMTFVSTATDYVFSLDEIRLAQNLAARNAEALENARSYTDALLLAEQADLASRNKLRFLGNISHELRTPLNAILAYIELISEEIHGPVTPEQHDDLDRIRQNQQSLIKLVDDLLTFVQKGAPRVNQIVRVPVDEAVAAAVALIENTMSRKSIRYRHNKDQGDIVGLGDRDRVGQILLNLLANAVKFTARGGEITTSCEATAEQVSIRVIDTGIGIDSSKFEEIFKPFVQVNEVETAEGGVGLGLGISRDLARAMHGELTVSSQRGVGSCFTLSLPRALA